MESCYRFLRSLSSRELRLFCECKWTNLNSMFFSYSHVTFVLDAHFYMLKNWPKSMAMPKSNNIPTDNEMNQKHDTCSAGDEMFRFFALAKDSFEPDVFKDSVKAVLVKAKSPFLWLNSNIADEPKQEFAKILDERYVRIVETSLFNLSYTK